MYDLSPPAVYVHEEVLAEERCRRRMQRVVQALQTPVQPQVFRDEDLPEMIRQGLLAGRVPMGKLPEVRDPILLFRNFRFDDRQDERLRWAGSQESDGGEGAWRALLGYGAFHWANYNLAGDPQRRHKVCRPCWRIHLQQGCLHRCSYCGLGGLLVSMLNIEEYCHYLGQIMERHPWQETFLLDDDGDPPCLEPEQGTLSCLIEYFGTLSGRYLVIHTKTWNTDWLRDLQHHGNTIVVWSLSGATQSTAIEPRAGTMAQRIEAARVAQEAGYTIRYKFKPIIPVRHWREEAAEAVERLFTQTQPDVISLCVFMWMSLEEMLERVPRDLLDEECVQAAVEQQEAMQGVITGPFPPEVRETIYRHYLQEIRRHDPQVPVSLSTESPQMWQRLGPKLGARATTYVCGCGPNSVPHARRLSCHPFKIAVRNDEGIPNTY